MNKNRMDTSRKIALFLPSIGYGGAERVTVNLGGGIAARGFDVDLVFVTSDDPPMLTDIPAEVNLVDLEAGRVAASLPGLIRYLRRERPLALLSALEHTNVIALLAARLARVDTRIVVSVHTTVSRAIEDSTLFRSRLFPWLIRWFYPWASKVVAVSEAARSDLLAVAGLQPDSIQVINNPVVTPRLFERAKAPLDHPWFAAGEPPVILGVGRLVTAKNFPLLLRAFALVRKEQPARLLILGDGEQRQVLESLADELGLAPHVAMPGFVDNPYPYMARAGAFVLSSSFEGLPTVLIEALALGIPVVSTDCPSGPSEILQQGRWGTLVPVDDERALAEGILRALRQPVADPGETGSWQPYELGRVVDQYLSLLTGEEA